MINWNEWQTGATGKLERIMKWNERFGARTRCQPALCNANYCVTVIVLKWAKEWFDWKHVTSQPHVRLLLSFWCRCYAAVVLLLCCRYAAAVLLLCCRYAAAVMLPWFCCYAAVVLLLCCRCSAVMLSLCCCCSAVMLPLCCCCADAMLLLFLYAAVLLSFCCLYSAVMLSSLCCYAVFTLLLCSFMNSMQCFLHGQAESANRFRRYSDVKLEIDAGRLPVLTVL